jgi:hypothetical protein
LDRAPDVAQDGFQGLNLPARHGFPSKVLLAPRFTTFRVPLRVATEEIVVKLVEQIVVS